jgi:hypothetical protein
LREHERTDQQRPQHVARLVNVPLHQGSPVSEPRPQVGRHAPRHRRSTVVVKRAEVSTVRQNVIVA